MQSNGTAKCLKHVDLKPSLLLLQDKEAIKDLLRKGDFYRTDSYLADIYSEFLSDYASTHVDKIEDYLKSTIPLEALTKTFIDHCFSKNINMDAQRTLASFAYHDSLSDKAVQKELLSINKYSGTLNLLGFGCGGGGYERWMAQFILDNNIATNVKIYGFDPYAEPQPDIHFITPEELTQSNVPRFDIVVARWVLHHMELKNRWDDFVRCVNHTNKDALVLIIEHGVTSGNQKPEDERLYVFLTATFDIMANIGIRPGYFTDTAPDIGKNFFVQYLQPNDWDHITHQISKKFTPHIYDIGPDFLNQSIVTLKIS